jgi:ribosomal protein S12 methylthiotransferase
VDGAAANDLPGAVPEELKEQRRARFMAVQEKISAVKLQAKIGRTVEVLVDEPGIGRSKADAPEIDGVARFSGGTAGELRKMLVDRADAHDLYGELQ